MTKAELETVIVSVYMMAGFSIPENLQFIVDETHPLIPEMWSNEAIIFMFKKGVIKFWGDWNQLSVVTFNSWKNQFAISSERNQFIDKSKALPERCPKTPEQIRQESIEYLNQSFYTYLITGEFNDVGNCCYNFLEKEKKLLLPNGRKKEYMAKAGEQLIRKENESKLLQGEAKRRKLAEIVENVGKNKDAMQRVIAKKLALTDYFKGLESIGTEISDLFE